MVQPLVSVIIPAYNSSQWIRGTIQSALSQSYPNVEVLVIDDASTDDTWKILQTYKPPVRVFRNDQNRGISATRNRSIQESRGSYIALLDHDDLWNPDKLVKQMQLFEKNPDLGLVFCDCWCATDDGRRWRYFEERPAARGHVFNKLLQDNFIPCPTAVIPKRFLETLGVFREEFRCGEEYELFLRIAKQSPVDYVDEPLVTYNIHDRNYSSRILNNLERITLLEMYSQDSHFRGEVAVRRMILSGAFLKTWEARKAAVQFTKAIPLIVRQPSAFIKSFAAMRRERQRRLQLTSSQ
jgi:glycosyltransferase involved in cell wall biosynthesis